jgi:hypothetical protein
MRVGHALVLLGALLFGMSLALLLRLRAVDLRGPEVNITAIGWKLACLPYQLERTPPTAYPQAFSCRA